MAPPSEASRAALSAHAGIVRSRDTLTPLLDDPHPLARLIARSALEREESRGCQLRSDYPAIDPGLDGCHMVLEPGSEQPIAQRWG